MRVAVVSSDGNVINQHFGKASRFLIFDIDGGKIRYIEERRNEPFCGLSDEGHKCDALSSIALIADCDAVYCTRVGGGVEKELKKNGIRPVEAADHVHDILKNIE